MIFMIGIGAVAWLNMCKSNWLTNDVFHWLEELLEW